MIKRKKWVGWGVNVDLWEEVKARNTEAKDTYSESSYVQIWTPCQLNLMGHMG